MFSKIHLYRRVNILRRLSGSFNVFVRDSLAGKNNIIDVNILENRTKTLSYSIRVDMYVHNTHSRITVIPGVFVLIDKPRA